jgi:hypothetical protein
LRLDAADLSLYARLFGTTLAGALPAEPVTVERRRSLTDRLAGRGGSVTAVSVLLDDRRYRL